MENMYMGSHSLCVLEKIWHTESIMDRSIFFKNNHWPTRSDPQGVCKDHHKNKLNTKSRNSSGYYNVRAQDTCQFYSILFFSFHPISNSAWSFSSVQTKFKVIISPVVWLCLWEVNREANLGQSLHAIKEASAEKIRCILGCMSKCN